MKAKVCQAKEEENLKFEHAAGDVEFLYERIDGQQTYQMHEIVPSEVVKQGEESILAYAQSKIAKFNKKIKREKSIEDRIKEHHIPIKTQYDDGTRLKGRIVEATDRYVVVKLDHPLKGESYINFNSISAMAGHHVFNEDHQMSQSGLEGARRALSWAYKEALHKPEIDLVARLNQRTQGKYRKPNR